MRTELEQWLLDTVGWNKYEDTVLRNVKDAVAKYQRFYDQNLVEKAFQISIWTDPQIRYTGISFETRSHAREMLQSAARYWRKKGYIEDAEQLEAREYNGNPADFKYKEFHSVVHTELSLIQELDYRNNGHRIAAVGCIETSLLRVVNRVLDEAILERLPGDEVLWFAENSPRDWHDHVRKIERDWS